MKHSPSIGESIRTVAVAQRQIPHYRIPFFRALRTRLEQENVKLRLISGTAYEGHIIRTTMEEVEILPTTEIGPFLWNRFSSLTHDVDLLIIPQQIKQLDLYHLLCKRLFSKGPKIAFWGHGKDFQSAAPNGLTERLKRYLSRRVDWWFAYNDLSARVVRELGFTPARITSVVNAIDTIGLETRKESLTQSEIAAAREELGISTSNVAIFTGGLYSVKRLPFLFSAAELIRLQIPDFELIVIGDGPEKEWVTKTVAPHPWIHFLGAKNDHDKVPYWALAKLLLMPGGVGLIVLDSFALGVPMVTTDTRLHGPEIQYLQSGDNGFLVECGESTNTYADAVVGLLRDPARLHRLQAGAKASTAQYTMQQMVENFAGGVMAALETRKEC
jgi:glycosyltransferase involved in cell wall biosynthesis